LLAHGVRTGRSRALEPILQLFHLQGKPLGLKLGRAVQSQRQLEREQALGARFNAVFRALRRQLIFKPGIWR